MLGGCWVPVGCRKQKVKARGHWEGGGFGGHLGDKGNILKCIGGKSRSTEFGLSGCEEVDRGTSG